MADVRESNGIAPIRPLRRDAVANRERILGAAQARFAVDGLRVSLEEIARDAGVGIGTFYRHFRNRDALLEELFDKSIEQAERIFTDALACADPWDAIIRFFNDSLELMIEDRGLWLMAFRGSRGQRDLDVVHEIFWRYMPRLVRRAQKAGVLRADVRASDFRVIWEMMRKSLDFTYRERPTAARRYSTLLLDGLRTRRDDVTPMPERALTRNEDLRCTEREFD